MNIENLIEISDVFVEAPDEDQDLIVQVIEKGFSKNEAERVVGFMPIAFGRAVIEQVSEVTFSEKYKVKENSKEYSLNDEPIYCTALNLAKESYDKGVIEQATFAAIATRSAELDAVNKALNEGQDLTGAKFAPVLLFGYETLGETKGWFKRVFS